MSEKMTPGQAWDQFVGEQTPEEFMQISREKGIESVEDATWAYVTDLPHEMSGRLAEELADLLAEYINQQTT